MQLDTARVQQTDLGVMRAQYEHAIAILTGKPPADLTLPPAPITDAIPDIPGAVPSQLLERRPDIAAEERRMAAANEQIGIAKAAYYPVVSLSALAGLQSGFLSWPSAVWAVGPALAQTFSTEDAAARLLKSRWKITTLPSPITGKRLSLHFSKLKIT
jgi:outer membrane protein TolC